MSVVESDRSIDAIDIDAGRKPAPAGQAVRRVRIALLGYGRVGQALATLAGVEEARLRAEGVDLRFVGALVRDPSKRRVGPPIALHTSVRDLFATPFDVLIDVMGGEHPAFDLVQRALETGAGVVTANKTLVARRGLELAAIASRRGVPFAFDAAVLAGVPFLGALARRPLIGSPRRITGLINGTSHFIACKLAKGGSLASALEEAIARGYAEPDSSADLGGRDAAEKLTILLHLTGCRDVAVSDLTTRSLEILAAADVLGARALGGVIKPAALASIDPANPGVWVGPALIDRSHAFSRLGGVQNAIEFAGAIGDPVTFAGPGAGPRITAATILDDVAEAVAGGSRPATTSWRAAPVPASALRRPPAGRWYLRVAGTGISTTELADALALRQLPTRRVIECGRALVVRTAAAPWSTVCGAVAALQTRGYDVIALPIIERTPATAG